MRIRPFRTALVAAVVLAATASSASAATIVRGNAMRWRPATVTIARGGAVKWKAVDVHHTVHSYGSNWTYSKDLHPGSATAPRTFNRRGTYRFYCTIHGSVAGGTCSGMCGKVVVG
ncbi:MAG: cupredoxin domain-containing protein [Actinomycetota bacterium]